MKKGIKHSEISKTAKELRGSRAERRREAKKMIKRGK